MRSFRDIAPLAGAEELISLTSRIRMLREDGASSEPLAMLSSLAASIIEGDAYRIYSDYHALTYALIKAPSRRVSGDIFMDYLMYLAVARSHRFALMAAANRLDEPEQAIMRFELAALGSLAALTADDMIRMALDRQRELSQKSHYVKDDIAVKSTALWSGATPRQVPSTDPVKPQEPTRFTLPREEEWLSWQYGERGLRGEYVSDEALEEIYFRLMRSPDWRGLTDDLWNLFAAYGEGDFLRYRAFTYRDGSLFPFEIAPFHPLSAFEEERTALTSHLISFMRGDGASPVLISGPLASGKTRLALSVMEELPELRLVIMSADGLRSLPTLFEALSREPLRFMLLIEGYEPSRDRAFISDACACTGGGRGSNILVAATTASDEGDPAFPSRIRLHYMQLGEFVKAACELIGDAGAEYELGDVRAAAVDYQVDMREKLTPSGAEHIAARFITK